MRGLTVALAGSSTYLFVGHWNVIALSLINILKVNHDMTIKNRQTLFYAYAKNICVSLAPLLIAAFSGYLYANCQVQCIQCKINLAIALYGTVHPHRILYFIFWHEDSSADRPTKISM